MIPRLLTEILRQRIIKSNKIIILYGPRQVGKTTLVRELLNTLPYRSLSINADELVYQTVLSAWDLTQMKQLVDPGNGCLDSVEICGKKLAKWTRFTSTILEFAMC